MKRYCYFIDSFQSEQTHAENGVCVKGFVPSIVFENEGGHSYMSYPTKGDKYKLPWVWSDDFSQEGLEQAEEICKRENEKLGLSKLDVLKIVASSMRAEIRNS